MPNPLKKPPARDDDKGSKRRVRDAKSIREHLTEEQIDKTLKDTLPASDPLAWY